MSFDREGCYKPIIKKTSQAERNEASGARSLVSDYEGQDSQFAAAFKVLEQAIAERAFPAASLAVSHRHKLIALKAFGNFTYEPDSPAATPATIFDVASVSKVVATTAMAMLLYQRGLLDLDLPAVAVVPEFAGTDPRRRQITLRMLLAHSSGLTAYEKLYLKTRNREELLAAVFAAPLTADPGTRAEYSDLGFITLAVALERLAEDSLDHFCQREIFGPMGMTQTAFKPRATWQSSTAPTQDDRAFRKRIIQGEVQDENASILGGVAGHAGVFATAQDIAIFADALLRGENVIRHETLTVFTRRESTPAGTSRALGWDAPSRPSQSGKYFSEHAFGHLGYTGTSLWIDPERELSITLLTNRSWPDCTNQKIKEVRPRVHDAVVEALEAD